MTLEAMEPQLTDQFLRLRAEIFRSDATSDECSSTFLEESGFDPRLFDVGPDEWGDVKVTRFAYRDSPYFLDISTVRLNFSIRFSPGTSELITHQMPIERIAQLASAPEGPLTEMICADNPDSFFPGTGALPLPQAKVPDF